MLKRFNDKVILTTLNPEAFLNFKFETWDSNFWICPSCNLDAKKLYVNGIDMTSYITQYDSNYALKLNSDTNVASFHIYTRQLEDFDYNLKFLFYQTIDCSDLFYTYDVSIHNRSDFAKINVYESDSVLVDGKASYLILRSNPKFTGNIKIVVDTNDNIFLDTFKISDMLADKKYRKQQVSGNSNLSNDIRNIFKDLPLGELFNIGSDALDVAIPKTKYFDQYNTTYNYGARLLKDELYPQDNAILAPLWINSTLPEYFSIFRLPSIYNSETYDGLSLSNLAFKYLEESDLIKTWNLKETSPLGRYLTTHLNDLDQTPAPVFLSLADPNIATAESDPNTWYGIAVDKGVLTGRSETPYFFNKKIDNFTELNAFVSNGFERNNLLCPNLLNLEFIFDDNDVNAYTMNRYFGLYLTENILYNISYYSDIKGSPVNIISLDERDISTFINSIIFDSNGNISSTYKNRIFVINNGTSLKRIFNSSQINNAEFVSIPKDNLFSTKVTKKEYNPFITLTINNKLCQGEQLRVINKTKNKIWEVYGIDSSTSCDRYVSSYSSSGYPTICQTVFQVGGDIGDQIRSLEKAFDSFADYEDNIFRSGLRGSNWLSIILNDDADKTDDWVFQRITSQTLNVFTDPYSGFNSASNESDITFFGRLTPTTADVQEISYDASYGPINFELYGNRRSIFVDFFDRQKNLLYSFLPNVTDKFISHMLYHSTDNWYKLIQDFNIDTSLNNYSYQYILDPLSIHTKYLIQTKENIQTINNMWNAYSLKDINISLMGINSVKDIDYTVYDASIDFRSEYWYKRDNDVSTYQVTIEAGRNHIFDIRNSYHVSSGTGLIVPTTGIAYSYVTGDNFNTFFQNIRLDAITETIVVYNILNGYQTYKSYKSEISEENLADYYNSKILLKYSLTTPHVSKWVGLGTDCRNNEFRLILNASNYLDHAATNKYKSNFIPFLSTDYYFYDEVSYPSFKYLTPGVRNWEDYVFNDINDTIEYYEDVSIYKTVKELMFEKPYVDIFSKLVYSNNDVDSLKNRSSVVHYNDYNQSISVLISGLNLSLKIRDGAKYLIDTKKYDKFRFSLISTASKNRDGKYPIEVIINENIETILMIWYQGNDVLNYTYKNSTSLPGKSLLDPYSNYLVTDSDINTSTQYSFVKTPFIINNSTVSKVLCNTFGTTRNNNMIRPYAQFNYNIYGINSIWNAFTIQNFLVNNVFSSGLSYNTFSQIVNYPYYPNINTFGNHAANYGYKYETNENLYINDTCALANLQYFLDSTKDFISYFILRNDTVITNDDFSLPPIIIEINPPRLFNDVYTYNGWFTPKLDNILEFKNNEDEDLISIVQKDFTLSNTNLQLYKNIDQLWYKKVVSEVTESDVSIGNAISYLSNFNPFSAQWDANYYIKSDTSIYINGYESSIELPSFFGSKLIKLPDYLELSSWDRNTVIIEYVSPNIIMLFNLTAAINEYFKNNASFTNNWIGLTSNNEIIDSYINDTIQSYYNLSLSEIKVKVYYKSFENEILHSIFDSNFIDDKKINYSSSLIYKKDEYIYKITIPKSNNYSYFIKFTLFEK